MLPALPEFHKPTIKAPWYITHLKDKDQTPPLHKWRKNAHDKSYPASFITLYNCSKSILAIPFLAKDRVGGGLKFSVSADFHKEDALRCCFSQIHVNPTCLAATPKSYGLDSTKQDHDKQCIALGV
eukprot:3637682-Amphidinium_carterae.1